MDKIKSILGCKICKYSAKSIKDLELHIKKHKVSKRDYLALYIPKKDLMTGEVLGFSNFEGYLLNEFNNKRNLLSFYKKEKNTLELTKQLYTARLKLKDYNWMIGEAESRSLILPPVSYVEKMYGCKEFAKKINFQLRFSYDVNKFANLQKKQIKKINIDTREKKPLKFDKSIELVTEKLDYGDYSIDNDYKLTIERKSLTDFIGTLSSGFERFDKEISGAQNCGKKVVVLIEQDLNSALSFNYITYIKRHVKSTPEFIFHRMRDLCRRYNNVQFLFCKNRGEAAQIIKNLLSIGDKVNNYDLQYMYGKKHII